MPGKRPLSTARRIGVTALFAAAALASGPTVAAVAAPSNCTVENHSNYVVAACSRGSGEYRAYTRCDAVLWPDYNRYGAWRSVASSQVSIAECDGFDSVYNYGVQVR